MSKSPHFDYAKMIASHYGELVVLESPLRTYTLGKAFPINAELIRAAEKGVKMRLVSNQPS